MRIPTFIGVTSLLIGSWLGLAFFRDVPSGSYPVIEGTLAGKAAANAGTARLISRMSPPNEP